MPPLTYDLAHSPYRALIGTGGVGSGVFFALAGDRTLGREESRSGRFLDRRDYCKLHIIAHYVKVLLGAAFPVIPVGCVGDDESGRRLLSEMAAVGLDMRFVRSLPGEQTLFSFCLVYPDGSGGNLTVDDSACEKLVPEHIEQAESEFARCAGHGIALAAPEVPLSARRRLLELGTAHGFLRVAAFTSAEVAPAVEHGWASMIDLLALNVSEAAALAGIAAETALPATVAEAAVARLHTANRALLVTITAGRQGSWAWDGERLNYAPALPVVAAGTAGAGDAHLAGIIAGLVAGLALNQAHVFATLVAALAVTSPHTIAPEVERGALADLAVRLNLQLAPPVGRLLAPASA